MVRGLAALCLVAVLCASAWAGDDKAPPDPPDVKKTVDAFKGHWVFDAVVTMAGSKEPPQKFQVTYACRTTAGGKAVVCDGKSLSAENPWDGTEMIAYDAWSKAVHFMAMGSDGEIHDHTCHWTNDTKLDCGTYKGGLGTQAITEIFSMDFKGDQATYEFTYEMTDGSSMTMKGAGKRK